MRNDSAFDPQTPELAQQQNALLHALFTPSSGGVMGWVTQGASAQAFNQRGLSAYRANAHELAERALSAAFPVMQQLLGPGSFSALARALWQAHPPTRGDLAQWGGSLAAFIESSGPPEGAPYLPDVARVEWALHTCAVLPDAEADASSLRRLVEDDPANLCARLAPGCAVLHSCWPVASIVAVHADAAGGVPSAEQLTELGRRMGEAEAAVVWRQGLVPRVRPALPAEAVFITTLLGDASLAAAFDATQGGLDLAAWLTLAVQSRLLLGVAAATPVPQPTPNEPWKPPTP